MYYFIIGSFEKGAFQNIHLEKAKYIGRGTTEEKFLALEDALSVDIYNKDKFEDETSIIFFDKYKDNITADLYFIENKSIVEKLDDLYEVDEEEGSYKDSVKIIIDENSKTIEALSYFINVKSLEEELKRSINIVNEYSKKNKTYASEIMFNMKQIRGEDTKEVFFDKLKK